MRIAVIQFRIEHLDKESNFRRIEEFVKRAAEENAQVVVFPEDCVTGSIFGVLSRLDSMGEARTRFQEIARKFGIDVVTGSCMEATPEGNFNTSYYIDSRGEVLGTYRKNHLYPSEYKFLKPGTEAPVIQTAYGKIGIVICWDMLFPEIFQRLKSQGVQIVFCPSYWFKEVGADLSARHPDSEEIQLDALCIARALEANCALIYVNAAGVQTYADGTRDTLIGHSQIVMPGTGALRRLEHNNEDFFIQELDLANLQTSAKVYGQI